MNIQNQIGAVIVQIKCDLDMLDHAAKEIDSGPGGREVSLAKTKIQEARHWLIDAITEINMAEPCSHCLMPKEKCTCIFNVLTGEIATNGS